MGNVSLMVLNSKSDCKIFKNTKDLQLQLKSLNTHNYVKMLNPLGGEKKNTTKISNGALKKCALLQIMISLYFGLNSACYKTDHGPSPKEGHWL